MNKIKDYLKRRYSSKEERDRVLRILGSVRKFLPFFISNNLTFWGRVCLTDKAQSGSHFYTPHYMKHLRRFKNKRIKLLEIGVGGYEDPKKGGYSLRMWKKYFPFGKIYAVDIYDKSALQESRIKIYQGSQVDREFLDKITAEIGPLDIIIDDGSHLQEHIIETFKILFPKLKPGGVYAIEDLQTSYSDKYGGDSVNLNNPKTGMNFLKSLTDSVNHERIGDDKQIFSMHFYSQLVFIHKRSAK